jgi:hypothetical protein
MTANQDKVTQEAVGKITEKQGRFLRWAAEKMFYIQSGITVLEYPKDFRPEDQRIKYIDLALTWAMMEEGIDLENAPKLTVQQAIDLIKKHTDMTPEQLKELQDKCDKQD